MEFNIKQLTNEQLDNLFHGVIYEINVRKAEKQNVDVGFWDSTGEYKESIEEITIQELNENIQPEEKQDEAVILFSFTSEAFLRPAVRDSKPFKLGKTAEKLRRGAAVSPLRHTSLPPC